MSLGLCDQSSARVSQELNCELISEWITLSRLIAYENCWGLFRVLQAIVKILVSRRYIIKHATATFYMQTRWVKTHPLGQIAHPLQAFRPNGLIDYCRYFMAGRTRGPDLP